MMRATQQNIPPTVDQFAKYQKAWDWFNAELFDGTLRPWPCALGVARIIWISIDAR